MKIRVKFTLEQIVAIACVVLTIFMGGALYSIAHKGGWYCEYCHEGSYRGKFEVEHEYGNKPCKCSEDSCHHFKYYIVQPVTAPKYVK